MGTPGVNPRSTGGLEIVTAFPYRSLLIFHSSENRIAAAFHFSFL